MTDNVELSTQQQLALLEKLRTIVSSEQLQQAITEVKKTVIRANYFCV